MNAKDKIRIAIFDDHFVVRMGLIGSIQMEPDMIIVAEGGEGRAAVDLYRQHRPDIAMMDVRLPGMSGTEATKIICNEFPEARVIMLSTYDGDEDIYRAFVAGARAYLLKTALRNELVAAIRTVFAGQRYIPPIIAERLAERMTKAELSSREIDVLKLIVTGMSNKMIAAALFISEVTVKDHVSSILAKLKVNDRTEAMRVALQRGIVHLD